MRKIYLLTFIVALFSINIYAQTVSFSGKPIKKEELKTTRRILQSDEYGVTVEYTFSGGLISTSLNDNKEYSLIAIKDFSFLKQVGKPALPVHSDLFALLGKDVEIKILETEFIEKDNILIMPALEPARDTYGAKEPAFCIDEAFYAKDTFYPTEVVNIADIQYYRSMPIGDIQICPVQYNPAKKKAILYSKIVYRIIFSNEETYKQRDFSKSFNKIAPNLVLNNNIIQKKIKESADISPKGDSKSYILITDAAFIEAAKKLATWKRQLGYSVKLISSNSWTTEKVKDTIHALYEQWTPRPDYFVILGDHDFVPGEIKYSPDNDAFATDLYYACMNGAGDYFPDMAHGRISVSTPEEALSVINKIVKYEATPVEDDSFYSNGLNCAMFQDDEHDGYATRRFTHTSEDIRDYMLLQEQNYDIQRIYYADNNVTPTNFNNGYYSNGEAIKDELLRSNGFQWNGGQWNIASAINEGKFYVFHRDHGYAGGSGWAHPYFVKGSIESLHNGDKVPVVFSINCHTGEFKLPECFSEKLLRHADGGAVGIFAASYYSYSGYNDGLSCGFIDALYPEPGLIPSFGSGGISYPNVTQHEQIVTMGDVLNQGLIRMGETWGLSRYTNELFHYFGDPAMKMWMTKPESIFAENQDTLFYETQTSLVITNSTCVDAVATLVSDNRILGKVNLNDGEGEINFEHADSDIAILTISKQGYKPYIDTLFVAGKPMTQFAVSDTISCDGEISFYNQSIYHPTEYNWNFGDGNISNEENPIHYYQNNGDFEVSLIATNNFGNDTTVYYSLIHINRPEQPIVLVDTVCQQGEVHLYNTDDVMCKWYDKESGELLSFSREFFTPVITESKEYQVESVTKKASQIGKENNDGVYEYSSMFGGMLFDAYQNFILKSVKVYSNDSAKRIIQLRDVDYNILKSDTITVDRGEQRIELNWSIEPYLGYKLVADGETNFTINTTGLEYPYSMDEVFDITGSTFVPNPTARYYFFYDWEVESYLCNSTKVDILAKVDHEPIADFDVIVNDPDISIENKSVDGSAYHWDFGDGEYSSEINPEHVYSNDGEYAVQLIVKNSCDSDTTTKHVEIKTSGVPSYDNRLNIFPNPAKTNLFVVVPTNIINGTIFIKDIAGRNIIEKAINNKKTEVDISNLVAGNYFIIFISNKYKITKKLLVM